MRTLQETFPVAQGKGAVAVLGLTYQEEPHSLPNSASIALIGTWGSVQWIPIWVDQLTRGTVPTAKAVTAILIAGGAIPGAFLGSALGALGRRFAFCILCVFSFGSCAALFWGVTAYGTTLLVLSFLVGAMTAVRWFLKDEMELRYLASATEGMRYASDKLRAENIAVPDGALEFAKKLDVAKIDQLAALFTGDRST